MRDGAEKLSLATQTDKPSCQKVAAEVLALDLLDKHLYNQELHLLHFNHMLKCLSLAFQVQ